MNIQDRRRARLKHLLDTHYEGRQSEFVAKTGMNQGELSSLLKDKSFGEKKARKIEKMAGLPLMWLDLDNGLMGNIEGGPQIRDRVPLISWVQAGDWCEAADPYHVHDAESWLPTIKSCGPRTYALRVRGESMRNPHGRPSYDDGDIIFVDPDVEAKHRDRIVVRLDENKEAVFKQLIIEGDRRFLKALNPAWPDPVMELNGSATICGVVIGRWVSE